MTHVPIGGGNDQNCGLVSSAVPPVIQRLRRVCQGRLVRSRNSPRLPASTQCRGVARGADSYCTGKVILSRQHDLVNTAGRMPNVSMSFEATRGNFSIASSKGRFTMHFRSLSTVVFTYTLYIIHIRPVVVLLDPL